MSKSSVPMEFVGSGQPCARLHVKPNIVGFLSRPQKMKSVAGFSHQSMVLINLKLSNAIPPSKAMKKAKSLIKQVTNGSCPSMTFQRYKKAALMLSKAVGKQAHKPVSTLTSKQVRKALNKLAMDPGATRRSRERLLPKSQRKEAETAFNLALNLGSRIGDVLCLKLSQVDLNKVTVPASKPN